MFQLKKIVVPSFMFFTLCLQSCLGLAANDQLLTPAYKSISAKSSIIMDVERAGSRIIAVGERGHILISDDEGDSWTQSDVPVSVTLTAVSFPSPEKGWVVGHDGVVLHTADGGLTWKKQLDGRDINAQLVTMAEAMVEAKKLELEQASVEDRPDLELDLQDLGYYLTDLRNDMANGPVNPFMDVWFRNDRQGIIVGAMGMLLRTEDGGQTWTPLLDKIENLQGSHYYSIASMDDVLFLVGERGKIFRSLDYGKNWNLLDFVADGTLFGVVIDSISNCVFAVGLVDPVRSCDKGETWQMLSLPEKRSLISGIALSDGTLVFFGSAPRAYFSGDSGDSFHSLVTWIPGGIAAIETKDKYILAAGMVGLRKVPMSSFTN